MIKYLLWYYTFMHEVGNNYFKPRHQLISCFYYPQLLIWLNVFAQSNQLSTHFKLMSFKYLSNKETRNDALYDIYFWNTFDITNNDQLKDLRDSNLFGDIIKETKNEKHFKINSYQRKFPKILIEPLRNTFEPIQPHLENLFSRFDQNHLFLGPLYKYVWP